MKDRKTSEQAEKFNALLREAFLLETHELDSFLARVEDPEIREQLNFLVKTADVATVRMFQTGVAANSITADFGSQQLLPGEKVGRFRVESIIAQGGMGLVYLGYDELLGRHVAIKTIRPDFAFNTSTQKRFIREAQILSQINDNRICQIYDFLQQSDCEYIVLEYIEGKNLGHPGLNLDHMATLKLFVQLADALSNAHQKGIIHRDLKPDNLMVTANHNLKILDFGIARSAGGQAVDSNSDADDGQASATDALTVVGSTMGTLRYMSPEQLNGEPVQTASDMYSVGVILQEALTGKGAYLINDADEIKEKVANATLETPQGVDKSLQVVIAELTHKDPDIRMDASQLKTKLQAIINKPERVKKQIMMVAVVVLLIASVWFWYKRNDEAIKTQVFNDYVIQSDEFGNQVYQILNLPIHNTTLKWQEIKQRTASIADAIESNASLSADEKNYLIGRVHMKAYNFKIATEYLKSAWDNQFNRNDLIQLLSESSIMMYWYSEYNGFSSLIQDNNQDFYKQQASRFAQLAQQGSTEPDSISAAYMLWRSGEHDQALNMIDRVLAKEDWHQNGYLLKATIYTDKVIQFNENKTVEDNIRMSNDAINAYKLAIERGRSNQEAYMGLCQMNKRVIRDALTNHGFDVDSYFNEGVRACEQALFIQPHNLHVRAILTNLYTTYAEVMLNKGVDVSEYLMTAKKWNDEDISFQPTDSSYLYKAEIHSKLAQINNRKGIDPQEQIDQAVDAYNKVSELNPQSINDTTIGILYNIEILMQYQLLRQKDLTPSFEKAKAAFDAYNLIRSGKREPSVIVTHMNTGAIYYLYAKYLFKNKQSPEEVVKEGLEILAKYPMYFNSESFILGIRAQLLTVLSQYQLNQSTEASESVALLLQNINESLRLFPGQNELLLIKANGLFLKNQNDVFMGASPSVTDSEIRTAFAQSIAANANYANTYVEFAKYLTWSVTHMPGSKTRTELYNEILEQYETALSLNPNHSEAVTLKEQLQTSSLNQ